MQSDRAMPAFAACQLLMDPPAGGAWNMAVDEVLLTTAAQTGLPTLRFYQWQRPTLSLGYFQKAADRNTHASSLDADVVRRLSGGGAILHDQELTYSLILPASHWLSRESQTLYDAVHQTIVRALNHFLTAANSPWRTELWQQPRAVDAADQPLLCFQRRSVGDVVMRNSEADPSALAVKIVGSAQRRRHGAVLQHGSLLLGRSKAAPELDGIEEITDTKISPADLLTILPERLAKNLSIDLAESSLPADIALQAADLQQKKYQAASWTERR